MVGPLIPLSTHDCCGPGSLKVLQGPAVVNKVISIVGENRARGPNGDALLRQQHRLQTIPNARTSAKIVGTHLADSQVICSSSGAWPKREKNVTCASRERLRMLQIDEPIQAFPELQGIPDWRIQK